MKINFSLLKRAGQFAAAAVFAGALAVYGSAAIAATAAGTEIKNLATVTYQDSAGNTFTAQSNEAVVTVAQVYSATLGTDVDVSASPGQTVYLPYVLSNTGNGTDVFNVSAVNDISDPDVIDADGPIQVYLDANGNGQPDAGESVVTSVTLNGGDIANLVVAVGVPATATAPDTLGVTLTVQALQGTAAAVVGSVVDLTTAKGRDTLDDTNESLITVTGDAVLVTNKLSVLDEAANQVTYTITVKNNGNSAATDVVIFDGYPENTTLVPGTEIVSGLLLTNGDTLATDGPLTEAGIGGGSDLNGDGDTTDADEAQLTYDLNGDGDTTDANVVGIFAIDASLAPNATVSLTYTVSYDPAVLGGGYTINNTAHTAADLDGDGNADPVVHSNTVSDTLGQTYGVTISDTGADADPDVNDGGDDDNTIDNDQLVAVAASGGTVLFDVIVTNTGNGDDTFELSVAANNFPAGTVFTFYDQTGSLQLTNSNGSGGPDTGVIAAAGTLNVTVQAKLPAGVSGDAGPGEFQATITAVSAGDTAPTPVSDTADLSLTTITESLADLHGSVGGNLGTDEDPLGAPDYVALSTTVGEVGTTVNIPIYIDNDGGSADSFQMGAGGSWDSGSSTLGALPSGWSVEFFLADGTGNPVGAAVTSTASLPADTVDNLIIAVVSIPADATQAVVDYVFDNDVDGTDETIDQNGDGDGDYPIFFTILSNNTGATDIILDAIDVNASRAISLTPNGVNQIEAGATVTYSHTLANNGNDTETVELTATNSEALWNNTVRVDSNGDGVVDLELGNLLGAGGTINVRQPDGSVLTITITDLDGDSNPEVTLPAGGVIPMEATVFSPASASPGDTDTLTISATNNDTGPGAPSASLTDQTQVINSNVRLSKTVAIDANCDGTPESAFLEIQTTEIAPGECAIWELIAENQGSTDAVNVKILDSVTSFTTFVTGSLQYCLTSPCDPTTSPVITEALGDDVGEVSGNSIVFYVGDTPAPATSIGGTLVPGEFAKARFRVMVD